VELRLSSSTNELRLGARNSITNIGELRITCYWRTFVVYRHWQTVDPDSFVVRCIVHLVRCIQDKLQLGSPRAFEYFVWFPTLAHHARLFAPGAARYPQFQLSDSSISLRLGQPFHPNENKRSIRLEADFSRCTLPCMAT
jgi:hypothetical protein